MSNDCKDTSQNSNKDVSATWQSICQTRSAAELSGSGKLRTNSSVFS